MIDIIISKFKKLEEAYDFTVIEGSDFVGEGIAFEFDANISIAKNLALRLSLLFPAKIKRLPRL